MNNTRTILCYGDSNTYGVKSDRSGRYGEDERWPSILKSLIGSEWEVIEDGMPGRTTDLDHPNPDKPGRNGWLTFARPLRRNAPVGVLVIMLGTNDLKTSYDRSAQQVAAALVKYITLARGYHAEHKLPAPKIILVSPPQMDDKAPEFESSMPTPGIYDHGSVEKSRELAEAIENVARDNDCEFFDAASVAHAGVDGVHMDAPSHQALAEPLAAMIVQ